MYTGHVLDMIIQYFKAESEDTPKDDNFAFNLLKKVVEALETYDEVGYQVVSNVDKINDAKILKDWIKFLSKCYILTTDILRDYNPKNDAKEVSHVVLYFPKLLLKYQLRYYEVIEKDL